MKRTFQQSKFQRLLLVGVSVLFAFAVLFVLAYRERAVLLAYDWKLRWHFVLYALLMLVAAMVLAALIWADLMRTLGSRVPVADQLRYYMISQLAKRLPGTVWYVASRSYFYQQHGESVRFVTYASTLELIISTMAGAVVTLAAAAYSFVQLSSLHLIGLACAIMLGVVALHPASIRWLLQRLGSADAPTCRYSDILRWLAGYVLLWGMGGAVFFLNANAVIPVGLKFLPYVIGSWTLVGVLSILVFFLPSNLGFTEVGLSLLLASIVPSPIAVVIAILSRLFVLIYELVGAGLVISLLRFTKATWSTNGAPVE